MLIFGNDKHARGCYREMQSPYTLGKGAHLSFPSGSSGKLPTGNVGTSFAGASGQGGSSSGSGAGYFISNISFTQRERFHISQCFNDCNYVYAFGHDPMSSTVDVVFTMFLTDANGTSFGSALKTMIKTYSGSRLSKQPNYASLTLGSATLQGLVIGMRSGTEDAEHNLQSFCITLLLLEAQNG